MLTFFLNVYGRLLLSNVRTELLGRPFMNGWTNFLEVNNLATLFKCVPLKHGFYIAKAVISLSKSLKVSLANLVL